MRRGVACAVLLVPAAPPTGPGLGTLILSPGGVLGGEGMAALAAALAGEPGMHAAGERPPGDGEGEGEGGEGEAEPGDACRC